MNDTNSRAKRGIKLLMGRQVVLQILTFGGGIVLSRVLSPAQFGLYAIATFIVGTFALIGDFGLAPSFVQRKGELTTYDLAVGFTMQQILTTFIVLGLVGSASSIARWYPKSPPETVWLIRALAFSLFLTSWRAMSALQLERKMSYDRLAFVEVLETLIYQICTVVLALLGYGVWSYIWATIARGLVGTVCIYIAAPWPIRVAFDKKIAKEIFHFGIPFQIANLIRNAENWLTPTLVAGFVGPQAVGFLTWASSNGKKPLLLADNIVRVAFPHFSRLQDDQPEVERILSRYINYLLVPCGLWFAVLFSSGKLLVTLIYTPKWIPAVPALILFAFAAGLHMMTWIVGTALNGLGKIRYNTGVVTVRTIIQFAVGIPLLFRIGFNGIAVANVIVEMISLPLTVAGLGPGALRRCLMPVLWILAPIGLSILAGKVVAGLPLALTMHTLLSVSVVSLTYLAVALFFSPKWMKTAFMNKLPNGLWKPT